MVTQSLPDALRSQVTRILEETAFMLVEDANAPLPPPGPAVEAKLAFSGRLDGTCWLATSAAGATYLAGEMLGQDGTADEPASECATAELLNILTAWVLDTWWGEDVDHSMGTPTVCRSAFTDTTLWRIPPEQRVVVTTDAGFTFICGVSLDDGERSGRQQ
jgi:hypothetical protein